MSGYLFLVAASPFQEYRWVIVPKPIRPFERAEILRVMPLEISKAPGVVTTQGSAGSMRFICRTELSRSDQGDPLLDLHGRELRRTFGLMFLGDISIADSESDLDEVDRLIAEDMSRFLRSTHWTTILSESRTPGLLAGLKRLYQSS